MKHSYLILALLLLIACSNKQVHQQSEIRHTDCIDILPPRINEYNNDELPSNIKFNVSNVQIADEFLKNYDSKKIFEHKLGKEIMNSPQEHQNIQLVNSFNNGLIETIQKSYDQHRPLIITPDVIWLAICQGVSIHINENFEILEGQIFKKNKPDNLTIRNDSLEYGSNHWEDLIASLTNESSQYTKDDYYSFFVPKFSTTSKINTTAYQITLLNSFQQAFTYVGETGCGIPYIRLTGSKNDWELIYAKLEMLDEVGMTEWKNILKPIIKEFINVFEEEIDEEFWQSMYKNMSDYNAFYISGWIIKFFPYLDDTQGTGVFEKDKGMRYEKGYRKNKFIQGNQYILSTLSTDDFPAGMVNVDLTWNNHFKNETENLNLHSGFFAIKQYDDKSLEPLISWAITEDSSNSITHKFDHPLPKNNENNGFWTPYVVNKLLNPAIYQPKQFKTAEESIAFIQEELMEALNNKFEESFIKKDTVSFIVLINGKIENIEYSGSVEVNNFIKQFLNNLEGEWFPALADPKLIFDMWDEFGDQEVIKIKVNSRVTLVL